MARAGAGARNIVVHAVKYRWRATGVDEGISLVVWPTDLDGPTLSGRFDYDQTLVPRGDGSASLIRQLVVTARIVRRVIVHAVQVRGYDPRVKGPELELRGMSEVIDLSDAHRSR